jgi:hypothetical protein
MDVVGQALYALGGLGSLVCFILVLIQMFQRGRTGLGIACIVLSFCCGIGGLVAFIYGWMNHRGWGLTNVMIVWTVCWIIGGVGYGLHPINPQEYLPKMQGP